MPLGRLSAALYRPDAGPSPHVAFLIMHRTANYMDHIGCTELSNWPQFLDRSFDDEILEATDVSHRGVRQPVEPRRSLLAIEIGQAGCQHLQMHRLAPVLELTFAVARNDVTFHPLEGDQPVQAAGGTPKPREAAGQPTAAEEGTTLRDHP